MASTEVSSQLRLTKDEGLVTVTLTNPQRANALSNETLGTRLPALLSELSMDESVRVVIVTGEGSAFCAGSELDAEGFSDSTKEQTIELLRRAHQSVELLRSMSIPSIAAIDGPAIGAGLGLAMACDIRIASPRARFSCPYVKMGLTPDMGTSYLVQEAVGLTAALEFLLTGKLIKADEALQMGLVSRIETDPTNAAHELSLSISALPKDAIARARSLVYESRKRGLEWSLGEGEPNAFADSLHSQEFQDRFALYQSSLRESRQKKDESRA